MEIDERRFKKMFPHLTEEMKDREDKIPITSIRSDTETGEKAASKQFEGYKPDVIDFLRRCDNEEQAAEIIEFLEQKREISRKYADKLRRQLKEKGVGSFGPKKEDDYYIRRAGL